MFQPKWCKIQLEKSFHETETIQDFVILWFHQYLLASIFN